MRTFVRSAVFAGLLLTSLPFVAPASAATCPSWTDPAGDATTGQADDPVGVIGDQNLDIVKTTVTLTADTLTTAITVTKLNAAASDAGDEFHLLFTVAGQDLLLYADRGANVQGLQGPGAGAGILNNTNSDGFVELATAPVYDVAKSTVTIVAKVSEIKTAATVEVAGKPVTELSAETTDLVYVLPVFLYDEAPAPSTATVTVGTACGSSTPAPAPTPTAPPIPTPTPGPTGAVPQGFPANGCNTVSDPADDAHVANNGGTPAEPDLDITGLALQATATDLKAFVRIKQLDTGPNTAPGHTFYVNFTVGGKAVQLITRAFDPAQAGLPQDTLADATKSLPLKFAPRTYVSIAGSYVPTGIQATYDTAHSMVILSVPRADLKTPLPAFTDGTEVTLLTARAAGSYPQVADVFADSTAANNAAAGTEKWTIGDNACFGPPPGKLTYVGKTSVQYSDNLAVAAKVTNADGKAVAGRVVNFMLGNAGAKAKTGADGVARATLYPNRPAGSYPVNMWFSGDATAAAVDLTTSITVTPEKTRIVLSVTKNGSKRTVTAKLRDDDGRGVAGQTIVWYVNGTKVASAKTNSAGVVTLATAKPTQTVMAQFVGVAGLYLECKASIKV